MPCHQANSSGYRAGKAEADWPVFPVPRSLFRKLGARAPGNSRCLRSRLYELRGDVVVMMCEETSAVIQAARLAYIEMVELLVRQCSKAVIL